MLEATKQARKKITARTDALMHLLKPSDSAPRLLKVAIGLASFHNMPHSARSVHLVGWRIEQPRLLRWVTWSFPEAFLGLGHHLQGCLVLFFGGFVGMPNPTHGHTREAIAIWRDIDLPARIGKQIFVISATTFFSKASPT